MCMSFLTKTIVHLIHSIIYSLEHGFLDLTRSSRRSAILGTALDIMRPRAELIAQNALVRQQLIILYRQAKKPRFTQADRLWLVLLASRVRTWKQTLPILFCSPLKCCDTPVCLRWTFGLLALHQGMELEAHQLLSAHGYIR